MKPAAGGTAQFAREWTFAFLLVVAGAALLLAAGHTGLGVAVAALCVAGYAARRSAMRKQGRGFFGHERQPR